MRKGNRSPIRKKSREHGNSRRSQTRDLGTSESLMVQSDYKPRKSAKNTKEKSCFSISFIVNGDSEATIKPVTKSVDEVFGKLHAPSHPARSAEEMKEAIAKRIRSRNP